MDHVQLEVKEATVAQTYLTSCPLPYNDEKRSPLRRGGQGVLRRE